MKKEFKITFLRTTNKVIKAENLKQARQKVEEHLELLKETETTSFHLEELPERIIAPEIKDVSFHKSMIEQEKTVVQCETKEEAEKLLKWAVKEGFPIDEQRIIDNKWEDCKSETCYNLRSGNYYNKNYFEKKGFTIIRYNVCEKKDDEHGGI